MLSIDVTFDKWNYPRISILRFVVLHAGTQQSALISELKEINNYFFLILLKTLSLLGVLRLVARGDQNDQRGVPRCRVSRLGDDLHRDRALRAATSQEHGTAHRASDLRSTLR